MPFETGEPSSGPDICLALQALVAEGTGFLSSWSDEQFFAPQGEAWSPAEHLRHLTHASGALVKGMVVPRMMLKLRFGSHAGPSRSFAEVRAVYQQALAAGGTAGRFTPRPEAPGANLRDRRNEILAAWTGVTAELVNAAGRWADKDLDRCQMPHPLLGNLTAREMLMFTVYHTAHHLRRIAERGPR